MFQSIFFNYNMKRLESITEKKTGQFKNMWKLKNTLQKNVKEEITREI